MPSDPPPVLREHFDLDKLVKVALDNRRGRLLVSYRHLDTKLQKIKSLG